MVPRQSTVFVLDGEEPLVEPAQHDGPEGDLPQPVVDLVEGDVLLGEHVAHVDPVVLPADAAVATDAPHRALRGVLERGQVPRTRAR